MSAHRRPPSLTVHTDAATGIRIVLAAGRPDRPGQTVVWRRAPGLGLEDAVAQVLVLAKETPAVALVLTPAAGDVPGALARCLERADLTGFTVGREATAWSASVRHPFSAAA